MDQQLKCCGQRSCSAPTSGCLQIPRMERGWSRDREGRKGLYGIRAHRTKPGSSRSNALKVGLPHRSSHTGALDAQLTLQIIACLLMFSKALNESRHLQRPINALSPHSSDGHYYYEGRLQIRSTQGEAERPKLSGLVPESSALLQAPSACPPLWEQTLGIQAIL